ncbi:MAG: cytochrome C oxidase subunit IV family protein [Ilumatobacteraceae bacterium]
MSTATEGATHTSHDSTGHGEGHGASDKQYVVIALVLAVLTAIEVSTYYVDFGPLFMPTLFVLMIVKFVIVVSYFMHLKFDNKLFSYLFYSGLILAVSVYAGALATFKFFLQKG